MALERKISVDNPVTAYVVKAKDGSRVRELHGVMHMFVFHYMCVCWVRVGSREQHLLGILYAVCKDAVSQEGVMPNESVAFSIHQTH